MWLQCTSCGRIYPVYEAKTEGILTGVVETTNNPFDEGKVILGMDNKKPKDLRQKERQKLLERIDKEKDEDIKRALRKGDLVQIIEIQWIIKTRWARTTMVSWPTGTESHVTDLRIVLCSVNLKKLKIHLLLSQASIPSSDSKCTSILRRVIVCILRKHRLFRFTSVFLKFTIFYFFKGFIVSYRKQELELKNQYYYSQ